ncbi:MAG: serpin family protein [Firmicutes bacterium]|nr:serpin family protein [Candidatus Colimorpha enterica]
MFRNGNLYTPIRDTTDTDTTPDAASQNDDTFDQVTTEIETYKTFDDITDFEITLQAVKLKSMGDRFALDVFDQRFLDYISENVKGNYIVSPLSLRYTLGMLISGAAGDTKTELLKAVGYDTLEDYEKVCLIYNGLETYFRERIEWEKGYLEEYPFGPTPNRSLSIANSLWKNRTFDKNFNDDFVTHIGEVYSAETYDFSPDDLADRVNDWARKRTNGLIKDLISKEDNVGAAPIVMINTLLYENSWETEFFNSADTSKGGFTTETGKVVQKDFMYSLHGFDYYEDDETQLLVIPMYGDSNIKMLFVLGSTENLVEKMAKIDRLVDVEVSIPKFSIETTLGDKMLVDFLKEYGANKAFDMSSADFSAMIDVDGLYVEDIIQKSCIEVREDGVSAAAASYNYYLGGKPDEGLVFRADRPFDFFIYTEVNEVPEIMFAGHVAE